MTLTWQRDNEHTVRIYILPMSTPWYYWELMLTWEILKLCGYNGEKSSNKQYRSLVSEWEAANMLKTYSPISCTRQSDTSGPQLANSETRVINFVNLESVI